MTCGECVWFKRVYGVGLTHCGYQVPDWVNQDDNKITEADYSGYCPCYKRKEKPYHKEGDFYREDDGL